jgi:hypothetical protein
LSANDFSKLESIINESNTAYQSMIGN